MVEQGACAKYTDIHMDNEKDVLELVSHACQLRVFTTHQVHQGNTRLYTPPIQTLPNPYLLPPKNMTEQDDATMTFTPPPPPDNPLFISHSSNNKNTCNPTIPPPPLMQAFHPLPQHTRPIRPLAAQNPQAVHQAGAALVVQAAAVARRAAEARLPDRGTAAAVGAHREPSAVATAGSGSLCLFGRDLHLGFLVHRFVCLGGGWW